MSLKCATDAPDGTAHVKKGTIISFGREGHLKRPRVKRSPDRWQHANFPTYARHMGKSKKLGFLQF